MPFIKASGWPPLQLKVRCLRCYFARTHSENKDTHSSFTAVTENTEREVSAGMEEVSVISRREKGFYFYVEPNELGVLTDQDSFFTTSTGSLHGVPTHYLTGLMSTVTQQQSLTRQL